MSSSNISNAPEQFLSDFKEAFTKYLEQEKDDVSLQKFYKYNPEVFKTHSNQTDLKATINRTFIKMIEEFEIEKYNKKQPEWDDILQERSEVNHSPSKCHTTLSKNKEKSVSSSSSESLDILSTEQWEAFEEKYQAMKDEKKWKVGDVYVEDVIYKHAKTLKYEK
ncbi:hypothetical protein BDC45DRAFT_357941 [Circinella umbellata]|nr:hypothetical protein BDC45DRAFT_357941 [Circinella umbellata]